MNQCPNCNERMWSANKVSLMVCLNPDCIVDDDGTLRKRQTPETMNRVMVGSIKDLKTRPTVRSGVRNT